MGKSLKKKDILKSLLQGIWSYKGNYSYLLLVTSVPVTSYKGKNNNFMVGKPGRHSLKQANKVSITRNAMATSSTPWHDSLRRKQNHSLVFLPKTHYLPLCREKASDKPKQRGILQNHWAGLFKSNKVTREKDGRNATGWRTEDTRQPSARILCRILLNKRRVAGKQVKVPEDLHFGNCATSTEDVTIRTRWVKDTQECWVLFLYFCKSQINFKIKFFS